MKQQLSSHSTRFWKVTFPVLMGLFMGAVILLLFYTTPEKTTTGMVYQWIAVWLSTIVLLVFVSQPLRQIARDDTNLYIQTSHGEISIPLTQIAQVKQNSWVHFGDKHPIVIHFSTPTPVGEKIVFLPPGKGMYRLPTLWKSPIHPLVEELRKMAVDSRQ